MPREEPQDIRCATCSSEYMHPTWVRVERGPHHTLVQYRGVIMSEDNPAPHRGVRIVTGFVCEEGQHLTELVVQFHKGCTSWALERIDDLTATRNLPTLWRD